MNLMQLKYAIEIARVGSLNKAAEKLCVGQPNLSRSIKELEASLGITIFERSAKGMAPTARGEEFLHYAHRVLREIDEIENLYKVGAPKKQQFSISVPRASYISDAFVNFSAAIKPDEPAEIFYKETNALKAIKNITEANYRLGIIRYAKKNDYYFKRMLEDKGLQYEIVSEFKYRLIASCDSPLAKAEEVALSDLGKYIEIAHADPFVPSLPMSEVRRDELSDNTDRRICIFERASGFELMSRNPNTFMWVSPVPKDMLNKYNLTECNCTENTRIYKDMLIYHKGYTLSDLDKAFITELTNSKRKHLS